MYSVDAWNSLKPRGQNLQSVTVALNTLNDTHAVSITFQDLRHQEAVSYFFKWSFLGYKELTFNHNVYTYQHNILHRENESFF